MKMKENVKQFLKKNGKALAWSGAVILLQTVVGILLWDRLPDKIATHFGINNEPDGWSGKAFTVFGMPLLMLALQVLSVFACTFGQVMRNASFKVQRLTIFIIPACSLLVTVMVYGYALGAPFDIGRIVWVFVGVLFAVVGNYLPKIRRNPTMGIKLPWTLKSDENWNKTHRMAGPIWVIGGLLLIICGLIGSGAVIAIAALIVVILVPMIYSFLLYLRQKAA